MPAASRAPRSKSRLCSTQERAGRPPSRQRVAQRRHCGPPSAPNADAHAPGKAIAAAHPNGAYARSGHAACSAAQCGDARYSLHARRRMA